MMAQRQTPLRLADRLPPLRGRISVDADISAVTWFRVGGPAEVLFKPADRDDLAALLTAMPDLAITVLGVGSNLLVRDGGVEGVVLRLGRAFAEITVEGSKVIAGAGALDLNLAKTAQLAGLTGLEFFCGIPGTIGGALRMNAGAYGQETKDVLLWAEAMDRKGQVHRLEPRALGYSYRHCDLPEDWIFLSAAFQATPGKAQEIAQRMEEIGSARAATQPIRSRTGGSTFKNPPGQKAWKLIDAAGGRGLKIGKAQVSEQHCNFLINCGGASAQDLECLGETLRAKVKAQSGINLEWEIKRIGQAREQAREVTS